MASSGSCLSRQVTDIRQLEDYRSAYRMANDSMSWGDDIVTLTTLQGNYFTFASNYFHESSLVYVWEDIKKLRQYNGLPNNKHDPIVKILLTHKSCEKHYNIVKGHLEKKPLAVHYNAFVEPQATNAPPNPLQGQNGAIREQNKAINADNNASNPVNHGNISPQAGKTHLKPLLFLLILVIFCLPFTHSMAYTKDLSKFQSVTPQRYRGFFVSKVYTDPQSVKPLNTRQFNVLLQDNSLLKNMTLVGLFPFHTEMTPPNKHLMRISGAVSLETESKSLYEPFNRFMLLTQNSKGGHYHA